MVSILMTPLDFNNVPGAVTVTVVVVVSIVLVSRMIIIVIITSTTDHVNCVFQL